MLLPLVGIILIFALLITILFVMAVYNALIRLRNLSEEGWSGIDVQLKRRYDLIPNLIETVKGYVKHEQQTLEKIVELRNSTMNTRDMKEKAEKENQLTESLKSVFALAEAYPDLKASENFRQLQSNLAEIEDAIQNSRRYYNGTVRELNTKVESFPSNVIAKLFKFTKKEFFESSEVERENVKVQF